VQRGLPAAVFLETDNDPDSRLGGASPADDHDGASGTGGDDPSGRAKPADPT
jgi:hypothetical protein